MPLRQRAASRSGGSRERVKANHEIRRDVHAARVAKAFPYICNQTSQAIRTNARIWALYDRWDRLQGFGIPPKPAADRSSGCSATRFGNVHFDYRKGHARFAPIPMDALPNNEHWRHYLELSSSRLRSAATTRVL
jgi:hypothetical protein